VNPVGVRSAVLAAALVLALLSRGDVLVLAALLAVGAWRPLPAVAIASALAASAWRWSSTALEDAAGAQAVLGPAGLVDPATAATAAWLGALALVLATPDLRRAWAGDEVPGGRLGEAVLGWLPALAFAASGAVVVAGPGPGGDLWARAVAVAAGALLARQVPRLLQRSRRLVEGTAALLGVASLGLVGLDAGAPDGAAFDAGALAQGVLLAVATGALAWAAGAAWLHGLDERRREADTVGDGRAAEARR